MTDDPFNDLAPVPDEIEQEEFAAAPPDDSAAMADRLQRCAAFPLNDYGNGQRFVVHFGRDTMFVPRVGWFTWSGRVWEKDEDQLAVRGRAQRLSDLILREMHYLPMPDAERALLSERGDIRARRAELDAVPKADRSDEQRAELGDLQRKCDALAEIEKRHKATRGRHRSFANTTGNSARIDNAAKEAGVALAQPYEALNAAPLDVNCETGVLRFSVTDMRDDGAGRMARVDLVPHDRDLLMSKIMPVEYDPDAPRPLFDAFLERVQPDIEMREFLKRWLGLSMSGMPMQRLVFFYGGGANGKSVLVDLVAKIMGNYAATARIESLTGTNRRGGGEATPDLIPLMGARLVRTSEPDEGQRLQEGLIKELTGGEPIQVRALHSDFIEERPIFKLTISGNHKPEIRGTDDGIWRRVMLMPFDVQIPESERDPDLGRKLWGERSGVLNWLVEGLCDALERGLDPPAAVTEATREYREESDPIGLFLTTCCVVTGDPGDVIKSRDLGHAFAFHLMERGMTPWRDATFAKQVSAKSRHWRHPETGKMFQRGKASVTEYRGLRFTDAFRRRFEAAPKDHNGKPIGTAFGDGGALAPDPDTDF